MGAKDPSGALLHCAFALILGMISPKKLPVALTIAGSDSGGGAGIQADLKTFTALGVHGTSVVTCLTARNPKRVMGIEPVSAKMLRQQLEAVFDELPPAAVKTGMLFSARNVQVVAEFFRRLRGWRCSLVVDPVLVSTSGTQLLEPKGLKVLGRNSCRWPAWSRRMCPRRKF